MIKIILVDDHNVVRFGLRALLTKDKDLDVVAECVNGLELLEVLRAGTKADVILTDVNMPEMSGIELAEELRHAYPEIRIVILTMLENEKYMRQAFNAGARGYLLKNISADEMNYALKHVHAGGYYMCSNLAFRLFEKLDRDLEPIRGGNIDLSQRELEVLLLIAEGFTNLEIAERLFTSKRTVEGHRLSLIEKTGSRNTTALIKYAVQNGIVK